VTDLLIAVNPDEDSRLPYLLRIPQPDGDLLFRTSGTWPRVKALYCYPVGLYEWPDDAVIVERVPLRSCRRRGAAIDLILDRSRENRSQLVFTQARGRDAVFWQSPRTRKQARPNVRTPTARAQGIAQLRIVIDSHERYAYRFSSQQVSTIRQALPCGDYGLIVDGQLIASVERKSLADLVASLTGGKLRYQVADLSALPRAAVVVEDRYSQVFTLDRVRLWWQTGWPNCRSAGPTCRWCSARLANSPRSGPTGSWPPHTTGCSLNMLHCSASHRSRATTPSSTRHPPHPNRAPPRSVPGPAPLACQYPTAGGCVLKSGSPGTTPTT
jgi:ERCC4 domain